MLMYKKFVLREFIFCVCIRRFKRNIKACALDLNAAACFRITKELSDEECER